MTFTYDYSQPSEYHFSLDSILTPAWIAQTLDKTKSLGDWRLMDLCAGCGVMGFELSWHLRDLRQIDFVEIQQIYQQHFAENVRQIARPEISFQLILKNYADLRTAEFAGKYDLILCNPPYFRVGQGKLSPSDFKNRCRFFIDSDLANLVQSILWCLQPQGLAYVLLRPRSEHGQDVWRELQQILKLWQGPAGPAKAEKVADIRGTDLVRLSFF